MVQQPGSRTDPTCLRARAGVDVVVKLEVADAQLADEEVDHLIQVLDSRRMAQVKVIPAVLDHAPAAAREERLGRELAGDRALHTHDFRLQP